MENTIFAITFFISYVITSLFATGGAVIAYIILGLMFDIKLVILTNMLAGIAASIFTVATDHRSVRLDIIKYALKYCFLGLVIGGLLFKYLNAPKILTIYSIFIVIIGLNGVLRKNFSPKVLTSKILLLIGGITHGLFGIGGPAFAIGLKGMIKEKSQVRGTMTVLFLVSNLLRVVIMLTTKSIVISDLFVKYWIIIPVVCGVFVGHVLHKKISQKAFDVAINYLILLSGVFYLVRQFVK